MKTASAKIGMLTRQTRCRVRSWMYVTARMRAPGRAGRTYPGSFEPEIEKNMTGTIIQVNAKMRSRENSELGDLSTSCLSEPNRSRNNRQRPPRKNGSHGMVIKGKTQKKK